MEVIKKNKILIILLLMGALCLYFSTGKIANVFIDIGREIQYPADILQGKILYKDLFCIYGPFSYLLNALLYRVFGANLFVLYGAGVFSALLITGFIYKISKKFLNEPTCVLITLFVIATGCLATRIFNFTLPYSYAILYGLVCFLASLFLLIDFIENEKPLNLVAASIFAGLAINSKYDFILYFIPLSCVILKTKNLNLILRAYLGFFISLILPFIILFAQGLQLKDLIFAYQAIKNFAASETLRVFYTTQGVYYTKLIWPSWTSRFFWCAIFWAFGYFALFVFEKNKFFGVPLIFFNILIVFLFTSVDCYLFLTAFVALLFLISLKKNNFKQNIVILSALSISLKSLWGLSHVNYGLYYVGVILISFFILASNLFSKKANASFLILLTGLILNYSYINISKIKGLTCSIKTDKGSLQTLPGWGEATNKLVSFINNLEDENPKIVIFPEGPSINFFAKKKTQTEGFYNSLIPLYVESFGEKAIIDHFKNNKPDYIVLSNFPSKSYGHGAICETYAQGFCSFVDKNYLFVKKAAGSNGEAYVIFEKR